MLRRARSDFREILVRADPAGLLSDNLLNRVTDQLVTPALLEIAHQAECLQCRRPMERQQATRCHILTPNGLEVALHVPHRCRSRKCSAIGKYVWANFVAHAAGEHVWSDGSSRPEIAMLTPNFGVTWSWHEQFSKRILHHHASFQGESFVHDFEGMASAMATKGLQMHG